MAADLQWPLVCSDIFIGLEIFKEDHDREWAEKRFPGKIFV